MLGLLRGKAAEKPHLFIVVVPQEGTDGEAAHAARDRLASVLETLQRDGLQATGGIGDPDPFTAIMNALQYYRARRDRHLHAPRHTLGLAASDLIERVQRSTATPVEHVVVDLEAAQAG